MLESLNLPPTLANLSYNLNFSSDDTLNSMLSRTKNKKKFNQIKSIISKLLIIWYDCLIVGLLIFQL